ncbi:MAG: hypothetical protein P8M03_05485 [Flavobacteriaceae bacterium]|nr:hypothetical protein [Flavobacteriaceae bacterium]
MILNCSKEINLKTEVVQEKKIDENITSEQVSDAFSNNINSDDSERIFIPDDNFENALISLGYDDLLDDYVDNENIENIEKLDIRGGGNWVNDLKLLNEITDLTGLNGFKGLTYLRINIFPIKKYDFSVHPNLINVYASYCNLESLDVSKNKELEVLSISNNKLDSINISNNLNLKYLNISNNKLKKIDFSSNTEIDQLYIANNNLEVLDVSSIGNESSTLKPKFLDVSGNEDLECFVINNNQLSLINIEDSSWKLGDVNPSVDCL